MLSAYSKSPITSLDGGIYQTYEDMQFKRPVVPELESYDNAEGLLVTALTDYRYRAKYDKFVVAEAA